MPNSVQPGSAYTSSCICPGIIALGHLAARVQALQQMQFLESRPTKKCVPPEAAFISTMKPYQFGIRRKVVTAFRRAASSTKYTHRRGQELIHSSHGAVEDARGMKSEAQNHEDITESRSRLSRLSSAVQCSAGRCLLNTQKKGS